MSNSAKRLKKAAQVQERVSGCLKLNIKPELEPQKKVRIQKPSKLDKEKELAYNQRELSLIPSVVLTYDPNAIEIPKRLRRRIRDAQSRVRRAEIKTAKAAQNSRLAHGSEARKAYMKDAATAKNKLRRRMDQLHAHIGHNPPSSPKFLRKQVRKEKLGMAKARLRSGFFMLGILTLPLPSFFQ